MVGGPVSIGSEVSQLNQKVYVRVPLVRWDNMESTANFEADRRV